jgi:hypothetical protein
MIGRKTAWNMYSRNTNKTGTQCISWFYLHRIYQAARSYSLKSKVLLSREHVSGRTETSSDLFTSAPVRDIEWDRINASRCSNIYWNVCVLWYEGVWSSFMILEGRQSIPHSPEWPFSSRTLWMLKTHRIILSCSEIQALDIPPGTYREAIRLIHLEAPLFLFIGPESSGQFFIVCYRFIRRICCVGYSWF